MDFDSLVDFLIKKFNPSKTFVVIATKFGRAQVHRYNKEKSLYLFGQHSPVRRFALYITTNQYFELFILLTILVNCVFLALTNPPEEPEYVFAAIYTAEMFLKIIAKGFALHKFAYLRDAWNWLDFVVVILGYITLAPAGVANLSGIRTFRVFRALRTISAVKGLKTMVNTLLLSMKMLWDVMILTLFFICMAALIGMQIFVGVLRNKCVRNLPEGSTVDQHSHISNSSSWQLNDRDEPLVCGNVSRAMPCPVNYTCLPDIGPNPNFGYTSFDHFGWAMLASFQLITLDFWENVYNNVVYALGPWCILYFIAVIFFGRFYLVNLVLAVVTASYENEVNASKKDTEEARLREKRTASTYSLHSCDSIMSLVYGEQDVILDNSLHKTMYDSTVPQSRDSLAMSHVESLSVFQVKRTNSLGLAQRNGVVEGQITSEDKPPKTSCHTRVGASFRAFFRGKCWKRFRARVNRLVHNSIFDFFIIFFILLNTLFMALEHHGMDKNLQKAVNIINLACTLIFLIEMTFKLIALSPTGYVKSAWNIFDGVVVLISIVDVALTLNQTTNTPGTSVLRTFRLLRVLKLAKSWTTMASLLVTIGRTLGALANLTVILAIVIYIFAVLGMQVLGSSYTPDKFDGEVPRWNFTDFWHSTMLVIRVLCGEWIEPLWDCMRAAGPVAIIIFVPAFLLAHFIILNLFLALLLSSFAGESTKRTPGTPGLFKRLRAVVNISRFVTRVKSRGRRVKPSTEENGNDNNSEHHTRSAADTVSAETRPDMRVKVCCCVVDVREYHVADCFQLTCRPRVSRPEDRSSESPSAAWALWLCVRYKTKCLVEHKYFEWLILVLIAASSIALTFEDVYLDSRPTLKEVLYYLNFFFAVSFTLEFLLKIVGLGMVSYFTNAWNLLDFLIVIVSLVALFGDDKVASIRSLRTLRALRPLRAISRFEGMKVVISSLFHAIPGIGNVLLVCLVFWLIFSIMGVHLFGGKFYKCVDHYGHKYDVSVVANKTACLQRGDTWVNSNVNFDDAIQGFLALLQVATFEGWMEVMEDAVDATEVDFQPKRENNMAAYAYFVVFIVSGSFFILNLFIGVIIDNFNQLKQQMEDCGSTDIFLTPSQRQWMSALKNASTKKPKKKIARPKNKAQAHVFDFVENWKFEFFILTVISINMVVMMVQHYGQSDEVVFVLETLNIVFTAIFVLEVTLRIIAHRGAYFKQAWNLFDFIIVILSFIGIIVDMLKSNMFVTPSLLRTLRVFRLARLLRLPQKAKGIRRLVFSLVVSLPALFNIGALLFLFIFIYSIVGMSFFGYVKNNGALNDVVNFDTFLNSMMLLFRVMTAAGWNDILDSLMIQPPLCDPNYKNLPNGNCGNKWLAVLFFSSYIVVVFLILINMYVAVILENYNQVMEQEKIGITSVDLDLFYQKWQQYDPEATQYIRYHHLSDFVGSLDGNLRIPKPNKAACALLSIPLVEGDKIHCLDLLHALVRRVVSGYEDFGSDDFRIVMIRLEERFKAAFPSRNQYKQTTNTLDRTRQEIAARVIVRAIMSYRERKLRAALEKARDLQTNVLNEEGETLRIEEGDTPYKEKQEARDEGEKIRDKCEDAQEITAKTDNLDTISLPCTLHGEEKGANVRISNLPYSAVYRTRGSLA